MDKVLYSYHVGQSFWYDYKLSTPPKAQRFNVHTHDMLEVNYILSGQVRFSVEGNLYDVQPGDVLIMRPAETHMPIIDGPAPHERVTVHFTREYLSQFFPDCGPLLTPFFGRKIGTYNQYHREHFASSLGCDALTAIGRNAKDSFDEPGYIHIHLMTFLSELDLAWRRRNLKEEKTLPTALSGRLLDYINKHLFEEISVSSISEHFHMSATHINRLFRQATGTTVWKYVSAKRLVAAREKIRAGETAEEASRSCGFGDYSAFYRAYRLRFSSTPQADAHKEAGKE